MYTLDNNYVQEVSFHAKYDGQDIVNVCHFGPPAAGGWPDPANPPTSLQLLNALIVRWTNTWEALQSSLMAYGRVECRQVNGWFSPFGLPDTGHPMYNAVDVAVWPGFGDIVADSLPSFAAVTMRKNTNRPGRSFRGSMRIGGVPEVDTLATNGSFLAPAPLGLWQVAADAFRALITLTVGPPDNVVILNVFGFRAMVVATPTFSGTPQVTNPWADPVTSSLVNPYLGSQVSRKVGHGT